MVPDIGPHVLRVWGRLGLGVAHLAGSEVRVLVQLAVSCHLCSLAPLSDSGVYASPLWSSLGVMEEESIWQPQGDHKNPAEGVGSGKSQHSEKRKCAPQGRGL